MKKKEGGDDVYVHVRKCMAKDYTNTVYQLASFGVALSYVVCMAGIKI